MKNVITTSLILAENVGFDKAVHYNRITLDMPAEGFPIELFEHIQILVNSYKSGKYPMNNWLEPDGKGCDHKSMYASIQRHIANASVGVELDSDSGMDHRLHAAIRLMMDYTRSAKGLQHPLDAENNENNLRKQAAFYIHEREADETIKLWNVQTSIDDAPEDQRILEHEISKDHINDTKKHWKQQIKDEQNRWNSMTLLTATEGCDCTMCLKLTRGK